MAKAAAARRFRLTTVTAAAVAFATLATVSGCIPSSDSGKEHKFLDVDSVTPAMHTDLPGVAYKSNYHSAGFEYVMFHRLKEHMKTKGARFSRPTDAASGDRTPQLKDREADMTIASWSITDARMKAVDFVGPYLTTFQGFLVRPGGPHIDSVGDLKGLDVCTWAGTTSKTALEERDVHPDSELDAQSCVKKLERGEVQAMTTDKAILYGIADEHDKWRVEDYQFGAPQQYGIGIRKGHHGDCLKLRSWLKSYVQSSNWITDIRNNLGMLAEQAEWTSRNKPNEATIDSLSCRDKSAP